MKKELALSALFAAAVLLSSSAIAAQDTKTGADIAQIEAVVMADQLPVYCIQQQQQQQQQNLALDNTVTKTGILLGAIDDQGFDA